MKKETVYAILLGISFGVVLSLVMIAKTKDTQLGKTKPLTKENNIIPVTEEANTVTQAFKITEPKNRQIFNVKTITIKGMAEKDGTIIVQSPIKDIVYKIDKESFAIDMPLALGENVIDITFYSKNSKGMGQQKELKIYYLDEQ